MREWLKAVPAFFVENAGNISLYLHLALTVIALFTFIMHRMRSRPGKPLLWKRRQNKPYRLIAFRQVRWMIGFQKSVTTIRWRYKQKSTTLLFDASFLHFLSNDRSGRKEAPIYFCGLSPQAGVWYFSRAPPQKSESDSFKHSDFWRLHKWFMT